MIMWCKAFFLFQMLKETPSILSLRLKLAQNFIPLSPATYYVLCFLLQILIDFFVALLSIASNEDKNECRSQAIDWEHQWLGILGEYPKTNFLVSIYVQDKGEILVYSTLCSLVFTQTGSTAGKILQHL